MNSPRLRSALAPLASLALLAGAGSAVAAPGIDASVEIGIEKIDACFNPSAEYGVLIDLSLPGPGATAVQASSAGGLTANLEDDGDGEWFGDLLFTDLTTLANQGNGLWTITVTDGPYASVSTFTLNIDDIDEFDFFPPPSDVLPASGTIGPDAVFSWTDNSGGQAEVLLVDTEYQEADLPLGATSWDPPLPLAEGPNSFAVSYDYVADPGTVGPLNVVSGSITWGLPEHAPPGYPDATPLAGFGAETINCYFVEGDSTPNNSVLVLLERFDDALYPDTEFTTLIDIELAAEATGVHITTVGGIDLMLDSYDDGDGASMDWDGEVEFTDLDSMRSAVDGEWTITVEGPSPSVSRFTMNVTGLADDDLYASPTNLFPAHGTIDVPADVVVAWDDPTGEETPDYMFVEVGDDFDADTFSGTIDIDATSWDPPGDLIMGEHEFFVGYGNAAPSATAGPITVDSGVIDWGIPPFAPPGHPDQTPLITFGSESAVAFTVGIPSYMEIALERIDDPFNPDEYIAFFDLVVPGLTPTNIEMTFTSGLHVSLGMDEEDEWDAEVTFPDLTALQTALDGIVTVDIVGPFPSTSEFYLNALGVMETDFIDPPTDLFPAHGAMDVPADVTVSWTDPTEPGEADLIFVEVGNFDADNIETGGLVMGAESWTPPSDLPPGPTDFYIGYLAFADVGFASQIYVNSGTIGWGLAPYAPAGYPNATPLMTFGGESSAHFDVTDVVPCPGDVTGDGVVDFADILPLLAAWGPCEDCPIDRDDNDVIDFADIVIILADYGPCE